MKVFIQAKGQDNPSSPFWDIALTILQFDWLSGHAHRKGLPELVENVNVYLHAKAQLHPTFQS